MCWLGVEVTIHYQLGNIMRVSLRSGIYFVSVGCIAASLQAR